MNDASLVEAFRLIPRQEAIRVATQIGKLRKVCAGQQPLEPFLSESLDILLRLFGAKAGAYWFRPFNAATLCPVSRVGFEGLTLSANRVHAHEQLVRGAWQAVTPQVAVIERPFVSLIGPIRDGQTSIGALQLLTATGGAHESQHKPMYIRALSCALALLQPAIHRRMQVGQTSIDDALDRLGQLGEQLTGLQRSMRQAIDQTLSQLGGASFGALEANQRFTQIMHELLEQHGLRVVCSECGNPAILRCSKNARAPTGFFVFDHYINGKRTFHGGSTTLPQLAVTAKPPRKGRRIVVP